MALILSPDRWYALNDSGLESLRKQTTCCWIDPNDCQDPVYSEWTKWINGQIQRWRSCREHHDADVLEQSSETATWMVIDPSATQAVKGPKKCNCPMSTIMISGCKCGGI